MFVSSRARATRARISGSLWSTQRHAARPRHLHRRERERLAAGQLRQPGRRQRRHHLPRLLLRPQRPLRAQPQLLHQRPQQRAPPGARQQPKPATASTATAASPKLPRPKLAGQQLLGRPRLHHRRTPRHHPTHRHRRHPRRRNHRRPHQHHRHRHLRRSPRPRHRHHHHLPTPRRAPARSSQPPSPGTRSPGAQPSPPPQPSPTTPPTPPPSRAAANGIADPAGNHLASDHTWSFTTGARATCPCSLWPGTTQPAVTASGDGNAVELGVKFTGDSRRLRDGVRFFKGAGNTGTHLGQPLEHATARCSPAPPSPAKARAAGSRSTSPTPVAVSPGTTYLASYYAPNGHYALNLNYFTSAHSNGPLQALANSQSQQRRLPLRQPAPSFPDQTWQASNYWVDLVFTTDAPQDTTAPTITDVTPAAATTDVPTSTTVTATFDEALDPATVTNHHLPTPRRAPAALVAATVSLGRTLPARNPHPHRSHSPSTPPTPPPSRAAPTASPTPPATTSPATTPGASRQEHAPAHSGRTRSRRRSPPPVTAMPSSSASSSRRIAPAR